MVQNSGKGVFIPKLSDLNATVLSSALTDGMSNYGEGCLHEPMRIFSDYGTNEYTINYLHQQPHEVIENAMIQTVQRASKCIVGIMERCNDTQKAIQKYLPFIAPFFKCEEHKNVGKVKKGNLTGEQIHAIEQVAVYEAQVYQLANQMLDAQILD
jgi:hypothetical protein